MELGISGRYALVCGASDGLGLGCARALVKNGVHVLVVARGAERLTAAVAQLQREARPGARVDSLLADVTTEAGLRAVFDRAEPFDIVIANAGGPPPGDFHDFGREAWLSALEANMLAPIEMMKATLDGMAARSFGRFINITSIAVKAPIENLPLSNGARSGLTGFVAGVARESRYASANVTINNLLPGSFWTARTQSVIRSIATVRGVTVEQIERESTSAIPARRFGTPEEFGSVCAFLCSAHAAYITGQNILVDGGAFPGTF